MRLLIAGDLKSAWISYFLFQFYLENFILPSVRDWISSSEIPRLEISRDEAMRRERMLPTTKRQIFQRIYKLHLDTHCTRSENR